MHIFMDVLAPHDRAFSHAAPKSCHSSSLPICFIIIIISLSLLQYNPTVSYKMTSHMPYKPTFSLL